MAINMHAIYPANPLFWFLCNKCRAQTCSDTGKADLAAFPGVFYCQTCSRSPRRYRHDCDSCRFLGADSQHEWYFCKGIKSPHGTIIARSGDDPGDYWSCPLDVLKTADGPASQTMVEAKRLVKFWSLQ